MKKLLFTSLIYCSFLMSYQFQRAQNGITGNPEWFIKPAMNWGFIYEHRSTLGHLVKGYPCIAEVDIGKKAWGHKLWHCENNLPDIGFNINVVDYRNAPQLGYGFSLAPYTDIPLKAHEKTSRLILRLCWGVAYLSKCFDVRNDPKNIAIGSHINSFVQFRWYWQLPIHKKFRLEPGFSFSHWSNARAAVPNLGLNLVTLNLGMHFSFTQKNPSSPPNVDSLCRAMSRNEILVYSSVGYNQREVDGPHYLCGLLSAEYHYNRRNTHKFGIGMDVFADQNYMLDYEQDFSKPAKGMDNLRMSFKLSYSYNIGRISMPIETGYYFFQKTVPDGKITSRLGVKYYSSSGIVFSIGLRTHFAVAYNFEYGIGYRFFLGKKR